MREVTFGIIGCGLMGREFASAAARWPHLPEMGVRPRIVAICDTAFAGNASLPHWYGQMCPSLQQVTESYQELLNNPAVEAVYCAVPHHLHRETYTAILAAGKHLMGEKPFGIDLAANEAILERLRERSDLMVRCSSEFPFFPAVQRMGELLLAGSFGRIIELHTGFLHSSDLNPAKPINWKRQIAFNGEYGCLGDLGMHACHFPFRAGWVPRNVRAILSNIVQERPGPDGRPVPCETWDNASLLIEAEDPAKGLRFPWFFRTHRIAPGEKNSWYLEILGTKGSARFSTKYPKTLQWFSSNGDEPAWQMIDLGQETAFKSVTGGIFEFGFSDAILQMWAGFLYELAEGKPLKKFAGCVLPEETNLSHRLFTAALQSQKEGTTVEIS